MPLFPGPALPLLRKTIHTKPNVDVVILTGRNSSMRSHIQRVLHAFGFNVAGFQLVCHPGGGIDTSTFKRETIRKFWKSDIYSHIYFIDDLEKSLQAVSSLSVEGVSVSVQHANTLWAEFEPSQVSNGTVGSLIEELAFLEHPKGYDHAVDACVRFLEKQWQSVLMDVGHDPGATVPFAIQDKLAVIFGSHSIGCLSDVDVCLLAPCIKPSNALDPASLLTRLATYLRDVAGVPQSNVYLGDKARCPRIVARLKCSNGISITIDMVRCVVFYFIF